MIEIHAKADARVEYVFTQTKDDIEYQLIQTAHKAANAGNWVIGECASRWLHVYGNGRTDGTFAAYIDLSEDKVWQCRRVWERFGNTYGSFKKLTWSHFREAVPWDDAETCLEWAEDCEATVAEMRAWHRAQNGLDLFRDPKQCETEEESRRRVLPEQNTPSPVKGTNEKAGRRALPPEKQNTTGTSQPGDKPAKSGKAETVSGGVAKTRAEKGRDMQPVTTILQKIDGMISFVVNHGTDEDCQALRQKLKSVVAELDWRLF